MTSQTTVVTEIRNKVAWILIDGPTTRNSLDLESAKAFVAACERVDDDASIGAAVVAGSGGTFCSGAHRSILAGLESAAMDEAFEALSTLYEAFHAFGALRVPTIAAVRGAAVGAGLNLALAADLRVVSNDAVLIPGFMEAQIHPGGGHLHLLARSAGRQAAAAIGVFNERISGPEAMRLGLAWSSLDDQDVEAHAQELAARVAADPQLARELTVSLRSATSPAATWATATEVERVRQMWSLARRGRGGARAVTPEQGITPTTR